MLESSDKLYDLSAIWAKAGEIFPYFERLDFDWDEKYREYIGKVLKTDTDQEFHDLLTEFTASLNDGHTKYLPPMEFRKDPKPFTPPEEPSVIFEDGVLTIKINDFLHDYSPLVREALESHPDVRLVRLDIRDNIGGNTFYGAKVAELFISGQFSGCRKWTRKHNGVDAASASQLARASKEKLRKYIEDGLETEEGLREELSIINRTCFEEYTDIWGSPDNKAIYDGPTELLISGRTISAAEDFTAMFKSNHRAVLVGEPTFGSTGSPYIIPLRCGGYAQVVSVGYKLLDGTEFIGVGIQPDRP